MNRKFLLFLIIFPVCLWAQQRTTITGKVVSATNNENLIGVSVFVKGTTMGTVTNLDGNFSLPDAPENAILVFSYMGFRSLEIKVNKQQVISVKLYEDTQALDEVVVIGYGVVKKMI